MPEKQTNVEIENNLPAGTAVVVSDRYRNDRFFVWYNDSYRIVLCSNVAWLQADRDYCYLHFKNGTKMLVVHPLKYVLAMLSPEDFVRVHRSYAVCLDLVERLVGNTIYIGKQDFPVSPAYREDLHSRFRFLGKVKGLHKSKLVKNNK